MLVGVVHSVGVLNAGDLIGVMLNFQVGLQEFDVHDLALLGITAIGAHDFQGKVPIMRFNKSLHQPGHKRILFLLIDSDYRAKALIRIYFNVTVLRHLA